MGWSLRGWLEGEKASGQSFKLPSLNSSNQSILYIRIVKKNEIATRWCSGYSESRQTLHSHWASEPHFLQL